MRTLPRPFDPVVDARFDVRVKFLKPGYARAVFRAIETGQLDFRYRRGEFLVSRADLDDQAGYGSDTDDPEGGCYIPAEAILVSP
jgi:hypothetical protein